MENKGNSFGYLPEYFISKVLSASEEFFIQDVLKDVAGTAGILLGYDQVVAIPFEKYGLTRGLKPGTEEFFNKMKMVVSVLEMLGYVVGFQYNNNFAAICISGSDKHLSRVRVADDSWDSSDQHGLEDLAETRKLFR